MNRRRLAIAAILVGGMASALSAQEQSTTAERTYRELRKSTDAKTLRLAERWYALIRLQEWTDASGKFRTSAKYVEHDPEMAWVKLRVVRGTGDQRVVKDVTIPLDKLNKICQARARTIGILSEKVVAAAAAEKEKGAEETADGTAGEMIEEPMSGEDPRGRGQYEAGLAGLNAEQVLADGAQQEGERRGQPASPIAAIVTVNLGRLPALLPPLPSDGLHLAVPPPQAEIEQSTPLEPSADSGGEQPVIDILPPERSNRGT